MNNAMSKPDDTNTERTDSLFYYEYFYLSEYFTVSCYLMKQFNFKKILRTGVYLKAGSQRILPLITVILPAVQECVHMHIYCLRVNLADCFPEYSACCKC